MINPKSYYQQEAKTLVSGKYKNFVIFLVINLLIVGVLSYYSNGFRYSAENGVLTITVKLGYPIFTIISIITLIVRSAFQSGRMSMFYDLVNNQEMPLIDNLKVGFTHELIRSVVLVFVRDFFIILWSILLIVPGVIKAYAYSMAMYLTYKKPSIGSVGAINLSKSMTKGFKKQIFLLDLSYLPWYLLGILTLGVLWFWALPRHLTARVLLFDDIVREYEDTPIPTVII